jgi:rod shape determining protein RodA
VLTASGICALLFTHIFLNIGMVISVVPITGLPLPLISYGGSFAVLILFSLGVLQSIWIHRNEMR